MMTMRSLLLCRPRDSGARWLTRGVGTAAPCSAQRMHWRRDGSGTRRQMPRGRRGAAPSWRSSWLGWGREPRRPPPSPLRRKGGSRANLDAPNLRLLPSSRAEELDCVSSFRSGVLCVKFQNRVVIFQFLGVLDVTCTPTTWYY
jgi:hypothetical protein